MRKCLADRCNKDPLKGRKWCSTHWSRITKISEIYLPKDLLSEKEIFLTCVKLSSKCWTWTGCFYDTGYGTFNGEQAHRKSYRFFKGEIPPGMLVLHSCDNKACVNPAHLSVGTSAENLKQAFERGLMPIGESHYRSKLKDDDVRKIIKLKKDGVKTKQISEIFGVIPCTIRRIYARKSWKHVSIDE